ncbi:MAG: SsrA-binding protein SmpB [Acidobacteriaceae bacterium]|nr:SsrA-binding protein SmpB [Acidobacteriaceae bacterium]
MARTPTPTTPNQPSPTAKPARPRDPVAAGQRDAAYNRSASFNYFLSDRFEAGVELRGTEVKSIREGKANLKDAYGLLKDGEIFLLNAHIGPFSHGNAMNHEALRTRRLLMHKAEIRKLMGKASVKGFTLIPTRLYFRNGRVKCELALAKGKQDWDKRETERKREADKEAKAAIARSQRR